jgi:glycine/serine hydroxymethyltransferase
MATRRIKSSRRFAPVAAAVGVLGLAAWGGDDPPDAVEVSSRNRAAQFTEAERHADLQMGSGSRACEWMSVAAPPTPDAVVVLENCDGEWTGNMEWVKPRAAGARRGSLGAPGCAEP